MSLESELYFSLPETKIFKLNEKCKEETDFFCTFVKYFCESFQSFLVVSLKFAVEGYPVGYHGICELIYVKL